MTAVRTVRVNVNGTDHEHPVESRQLLVHYLRETLGLTGTHIGCETSLCGACTVLLDGKAVKSCTMFAIQADQRTVVTVEGLAQGDELHRVQQGFWECHGLQCGFCTPGMIMTAAHLLQETPKPTREQIAHGLKGNLCRCTGYSHIIDAVNYAAGQHPGHAEGPK